MCTTKYDFLSVTYKRIVNLGLDKVLLVFYRKTVTLGLDTVAVQLEALKVNRTVIIINNKHNKTVARQYFIEPL